MDKNVNQILTDITKVFLEHGHTGAELLSPDCPDTDKIVPILLGCWMKFLENPTQDGFPNSVYPAITVFYHLGYLRGRRAANAPVFYVAEGNDA